MRGAWLAVMALMSLMTTGVSTVTTAATQVAPSMAASVIRAIDANALKPAECADLDLSAIVTTGTGTDANELILGTGSGETLVGGGGDDCIVAGAGDDILVGGSGFDVCLGGLARDSYDPSCEVQVEAAPGVPDPPTELDASATSSSSIALSWTDGADNEDGFAVERSPAGSGSWEQITSVAADVTDHTDTGLTVGAAYDYRVRAFNSSAYSTYSNVASASTVSCPTPGTITVYANADTYVYEAAPTPDAGTDPSLYVMSSVDGNVRTLVGFPLPAIPEGCEITAATLRLESTSETAGRTLEVHQATGAWTEAGVTWGNQPATTGTAAATSSGLGWLAWSVTEQVHAMYTAANHGFVIRDSAEYAAAAQFQVFSSREGGNAPELVVSYDSPPPPPVPPSAPTQLTATTASGSEIDLAWTDNADNEDGFTIERSPGGQNTWTEIATIEADVTTHSDTGLATDTTYDYRVRAFNTGGTSTWSNTASATTPAGCQSPGSLTITADRDVFVAQEAPTTNFQNSTYQEFLAVQSRNGNRNARALVRFELPAVPTGCTIVDATLRLHADSATAGRTLLAHQAATTWTETGVTWNSQPGTAGVAASTISGTGWRDWAVITEVTAMYAGVNHGFVIRDSAESASSTLTQAFSSREGSNPPQLVITLG